MIRYFHAFKEIETNAPKAQGECHQILHWRERFRRKGGKLHWIAQTTSYDLNRPSRKKRSRRTGERCWRRLASLKILEPLQPHGTTSLLL